MASKNIGELEFELQKLKEKEARIKEELVLKRKAADARTKKELAKNKYAFADIFVNQFGEEILGCKDELEFFISAHVQEIQDIIYAYGKQE